MHIYSKKSQKRTRVYIRRILRSIAHRMDMGKTESLTEIQQSAVHITRRMICHPKSELVYAPISHLYYVENEHYYIRLGDNAVTITNGKFSYYIWLPAKTTDDLRGLFYRILESRKNNIDKKYDLSTLQNLQEIAKNLEVKDGHQ
jgi:hypothetical protein